MDTLTDDDKFLVIVVAIIICVWLIAYYFRKHKD